MTDVSLIHIGESSIPYSTSPVGSNVIMSDTTPHTGLVYAITAAGGYSVGRTFDNILRLPEYMCNQYDTTKAVEVYFDVRMLNMKIGIDKDGENIGVTVPSVAYYDISQNVFYKDSLTITSEDFLTNLDGNQDYVISVGALSTTYSDFSQYILDYFFYGSKNLSQHYPTQFNFSSNQCNNGVFDASAFLNIITYDPSDGITQHNTTGISGSISVFNISSMLRYAVDTNCFGNRDPSSGTTASDPYHPANYGVTDGFLADDLIFIPENGIQITLQLSIIDIDTSANKYAAALGLNQDTTVDNFSTSGNNNGLVSTNFNEITCSYSQQIKTTAISKTESVPLLLRLANLSGSSVPFSA